jgi:uncharacterized membrane protein
MTWYELWLFLHVVAVLAWVGGAGIVQVFGVLTRRAGDPQKTAFFVRNLAWTVTRIFLPAAVVTFLTGVALVEEGRWDWDEPFVLWGLILWAAVALVAFGYLARAMGEAGERLGTEGPSPALAVRLRNLVWLSRALLAALVVIVFLMTVKPGT